MVNINKKILFIGLFVAIFFVIPTLVIGFNRNCIDPEDDVIYLENFQYNFELETFDLEDLAEKAEHINSKYVSTHPHLDITEIEISEEGNDTVFVATIKEPTLIYLTDLSNVFVMAIAIIDDGDSFAVAHVKYALLFQVSKYGYLEDFDNIKDCSFVHSGNKLSFRVPTEDVPNDIDEIYALIGIATISDLDIENVKFKISNIYGDIYPNSLYEHYISPENNDNNESNDSDNQENTLSDIIENPFTVGLIAMFGIIGLVTIISIKKD